MIESLFSAIFEVFVLATGRPVLGWFGKKQPSDMMSALTGLAFGSRLGCSDCSCILGSRNSWGRENIMVGMKLLLKSGLVMLCAMAATALLLGAVLCGVFKMEPTAIVEKMNSKTALYIFPVIILFEFCFFANDILVHLSKKHQLNFGLEFSEIRFTYDNDNNNTLIPLRAKLLQLYPGFIALSLFGFVLVLLNQ